MDKNKVIQHRSNSHLIFLTSITLLVGLGEEKTHYYFDLLLIISLVYLIVIFSNMYKELSIVKADKCINMCILFRNQITLILPTAFLTTIILSKFEKLSFQCYFLMVVCCWIFLLILLYILVENNHGKE